jgi:hypothetical protein
MEETNPTLSLGSIDYWIMLRAVDTKIDELTEVPY